MLDVRERDAFEPAISRERGCCRAGSWSCASIEELPDPTRRILAYCEFGRISTLAAATLRQMGFQGAVALDGGMKAWREAGFPVKSGKES